MGDFKNTLDRVFLAVTVALSAGLVFFVAAMIFPHGILRIFTRFPEVIDTGVDYVRWCAPTFILLAVTQSFTIALRATQQTRLPLYASATALAVNTVLNYMLIFGKFGFPQLGVAGAAIATSIARLIEMCLILYMVFGRKNVIAADWESFSAIIGSLRSGL